MYFYILENIRNEFYKGISNNPERRLKEHNNNYAIGTRGKGPWKLVYVVECSNLKEARDLERYYKSGIGREKLSDIIKNLPS